MLHHFYFLCESAEALDKHLRDKLAESSNVGIVLFVENYSEFTLGDPSLHVENGWGDTRYELYDTVPGKKIGAH